MSEKRTPASASVRRSARRLRPSPPSPGCPAADGSRAFTGQVGKVLGERWKALDQKQRTPYEAKAKTDKERYESEKASYAVRDHTLVYSSTEPDDGLRS